MSDSPMGKETKKILLDFLEKEIDSTANKIIVLKERQDHFAYGQLQVLMTFRRLLSDTVTDELVEPKPQRTDLDRGFVSALEKVLVQMGLMEQKALSQRFESQLTASQKRQAASPILYADIIQKISDDKSKLVIGSDLERNRVSPVVKITPPKPQSVPPEFKAFLENEINTAAKKIIDKKSLEFDHYANGKLSYLLTLRRWMDGTSTKEDLGLHDAVNDVLQRANIRTSSTSYLSEMLKKP